MARNYWRTRLPLPCTWCGLEVSDEHAWDVGHIIPRSTAPELTWDVSNQWPEHASCNRAAGARITNQRRRQRMNIHRSW